MFSFTIGIYVVNLQVESDIPRRKNGSSCRPANNVGFITIIVMSLSGGIAGLAGMAEVSGIHHRLHPNILLGYGYTGIIIAWLSKNNLLAVILVSVLFGILAVGGDIIQIHQIPSAIVKILQGLIFFSVLASDTVMKYRVKCDA